MTTLLDMATKVDTADLLTQKDGQAGDRVVLKAIAEGVTSGKSDNEHLTIGSKMLLTSGIGEVRDMFTAIKSIHRSGNNDTKPAHCVAMAYGATHNESVILGRLILFASYGNVVEVNGEVELLDYQGAQAFVNRWSSGSRLHTCKGITASPRKSVGYGHRRYIDSPSANRVYRVGAHTYTMVCDTHGANRSSCVPACRIGLKEVEGEVFEATPSMFSNVTRIGAWFGDTYQKEAEGEVVNEAVEGVSPIATLNAKIRLSKASRDTQISDLMKVQSLVARDAFDSALASVKSGAQADLDDLISRKDRVGALLNSMDERVAERTNMESVKHLFEGDSDTYAAMLSPIDDAIDAIESEIADLIA